MQQINKIDIKKKNKQAGINVNQNHSEALYNMRYTNYFSSNKISKIGVHVYDLKVNGIVVYMCMVWFLFFFQRSIVRFLFFVPLVYIVWEFVELMISNAHYRTSYCILDTHL